MKSNRHKLNFEKLVVAIRQVHAYMAAQAGRAINISLTRLGAISWSMSKMARIGRNTEPKFLNVWARSCKKPSINPIQQDTFAFADSCISLTPILCLITLHFDAAAILESWDQSERLSQGGGALTFQDC
jgi:hypothetical protein